MAQQQQGDRGRGRLEVLGAAGERTGDGPETGESRKPKRKNTRNQPRAPVTVGRSAPNEVKLSPTSPMAAYSAIWATASAVLPSTLPASSWRTGILVAMISTMRDCFSSTTLPARVMPNDEVERSKRNARANAIPWAKSRWSASPTKRRWSPSEPRVIAATGGAGGLGVLGQGGVPDHRLGDLLAGLRHLLAAHEHPARRPRVVSQASASSSFSAAPRGRVVGRLGDCTLTFVEPGARSATCCAIVVAVGVAATS